MRAILLWPSFRFDSSGIGPRGISQGMNQCAEFTLHFGRRFTLVLCNKVRERRLHPERFQALLYGSVIDIGEEESRGNLTFFHVSDKGLDVGEPRVSHTMLPHRLHELWRLPRHSLQVR